MYIKKTFSPVVTPFLAMTGTADKKTQATIISLLSLQDPVKILISPERKNLRISVTKCKKTAMFGRLDWLIDLAIEKGVNMPKTIIFCNMMNEMASVCNYLLFKLGKDAYPKTASGARDCIVGIYHSMTWAATKERLLASFKGSGDDTNKRIVIASTALSMGVNFPNVHYVINWGPPRTLIDYHQEAGRAGRDGEHAHSIIIYHGNQTAHCEDDVKQFVRTEECYRVASLKPFVANVVPVAPPHDCCSNCCLNCKCIENCSNTKLPFEKDHVPDHEALPPLRKRDISDQQRNDMQDALTELKDKFKGHCPLEAHGFFDELVQQLVNNCSTIFTISDILSFPVFSVRTALQIQEVFQDIFDDMEEVDNIPDLFSTPEPYTAFDFDFSDMGEECLTEFPDNEEVEDSW